MELMQTCVRVEMISIKVLPFVAGVPFRETHHLSGAAVKMAEDKECELSDLTADDLRTIHPFFEDDVVEVWDFDASAEKRDTEGGTSRRSVLEQAEKLKNYLEASGLQ